MYIGKYILQKHMEREEGSDRDKNCLHYKYSRYEAIKTVEQNRENWLHGQNNALR